MTKRGLKVQHAIKRTKDGLEFIGFGDELEGKQVTIELIPIKQAMLITSEALAESEVPFMTVTVSNGYARGKEVLEFTKRCFNTERLAYLAQGILTNPNSEQEFNFMQLPERL